MRISLLLPHGGPGGATRAVVRMATGLRARGHTVRILCRQRSWDLRMWLQSLWLSARYGKTADWLESFDGVLVKYADLRDHAFAPDELVVATCTRTTMDAANLPETAGIKVLHCHGVEPDNREAMLHSWQLPMHKLAVSRQVAAEIQRHTGQPVIGVVPDGVDAAECFVEVPDNRRTGIGVSYRSPNTKDPRTTLAVLQGIEQRLPEATIYCFSPERRPLHLPRQVRYTRLPSAAQIRRVYNACKVWFLASRSEGFGMTVLEAMACGCAVVSTDSGGPADIIEHGRNGFLVPVGDAGGLLEHIERLCRDDALRERMREEGLKTAAAFSWVGAAAKMEGCLQAVLGLHAASSSRTG